MAILGLNSLDIWSETGSAILLQVAHRFENQSNKTSIQKTSAAKLWKYFTKWFVMGT